MTTYIEQSDDYLIAKDERLGNILIVQSPWSNRYLDIVAEYDIRTIRLNELAGWPDSDISFLDKVPGIQGLVVLSEKVTDVSPVFKLRKLKSLSLHCKAKVADDFAKLSNLRDVSLRWRNVYRSFHALDALERMNLTDFPDNDLTNWKRNEHLIELLLESKSLERLVGIERFPKLSRLDLHKCRNLESLDAISSSTSIKQLSISRCSGVQDLSPVAHLSELRVLEIEDCQDIQSLTPIAACKNLERLQVAGNTTIIDGDFSRLFELRKLKQVLIRNRKHYSHSDAELEHGAGHV
jgi:Leucine-rich repeat (LRR) protein